MIAERWECSKVKYQINSVIAIVVNVGGCMERLLRHLEGLRRPLLLFCAANLTLPIMLPQTRIREFFVGIAGPIL